MHVHWSFRTDPCMDRILSAKFVSPTSIVSDDLWLGLLLGHLDYFFESCYPYY